MGNSVLGKLKGGKRCSCCGVPKIRGLHFHRDPYSPDGYSSWCSECRLARNRLKNLPALIADLQSARTAS